MIHYVDPVVKPLHRLLVPCYSLFTDEAFEAHKGLFAGFQQQNESFAFLISSLTSDSVTMKSAQLMALCCLLVAEGEWE